jgi:3-ketosteroid 9alpha-monooxygenase subunit A
MYHATMQSNGPEGFPRGWFVVAFSEELGSGDVRPLRYFAQDLVLFRGWDGEARVLDAHCPHMGAHLGFGGTVVDDTVRCPFHAWRFGGDGRCVDVPYASKIPPRACVRSWTVQERNGVVLVWYSPTGQAPDYEIPELPEYGAHDWTSWRWSMREIRTQCREIVENVADLAHFPTVHGTDVLSFENDFAGHIAVQRSEGLAHPKGGGTDRFKLTATYYGPAYQISVMDSALPNRLLNCHTPIDEHRLHLRFGVMLPVMGDRARTEGFAERYVDNLTVGFGQDVQIWEHKRWRDRPLLCDGDGAIGKLRRWYRQFYEDTAATSRASD